MKLNVLPFFGEKWNGVPDPTTSFAGQTIIVTGSNTGLGFEAAAKFVALDAEQVILAVRNISKGEAARREIEARTHRLDCIEVWELDMGEYASIQTFASRVDRELPRLDIAILNAGVEAAEYRVGSEGWETHLQVHVMGTSLLALLLLPKLKASKCSEREIPHLVIVTSVTHGWLDLTDLPDPAEFGGNMLEALNAGPVKRKDWDPLVQYSTSKLFEIYVSTALAALVTQPYGEIQVIVTPTCPGMCKSDLARELCGQNFLATLGMKLVSWIFAKSTEQGGRTYVWAASLGPEAHGKFYATTVLTQPGELVTSEKGKALQHQVWTEIVQSLATKVPALKALAPWQVQPLKDSGRIERGGEAKITSWTMQLGSMEGAFVRSSSLS